MIHASSTVRLPGFTREQVVELILRFFKSGDFVREVLAHEDHRTVLWVVEKLASPAINKTFISAYEMRVSPDGWGYLNHVEGRGMLHVDCPLQYFGLAPQRDAEWRGRVVEFHALPAAVG